MIVKDDEIVMAANTILSEILTEASYIAAESEDVITIAKAIQQAVYNLAHDPDGTLH